MAKKKNKGAPRPSEREQLVEIIKKRMIKDVTFDSPSVDVAVRLAAQEIEEVLVVLFRPEYAVVPDRSSPAPWPGWSVVRKYSDDAWGCAIVATFYGDNTTANARALDYARFLKDHPYRLQ